MILDDSSERKIYRNKAGVTCYADIPLGLYIVRGDSVVLMGQVNNDDDDHDQDQSTPHGMKRMELEELQEMISKEEEQEQEEILEWDFDKDLQA